MSAGRRFAVHLALGGFLVAGTLLLVWLFLPEVGSRISSHPAFYPSAFTAMSILVVSLAVVLWLESAFLQRAWFRRVAVQAELGGLKHKSALRERLNELPDLLDLAWGGFLRTGVGREMRNAWAAAGMRWKPSRYPSLLLVLAGMAYMTGVRVAGPVLGAALAGTAVWGIMGFVKSRAERRHRLVDEQLPAAIDSIAAGVASGQSFQLALHATAEEQPGVLGPILKSVSIRLRLGMPVEEALRQLLEEHTQEGLALVVEGIILQRQFGGDLVRMLDDAAGLLRRRHELECEVRAITAQGRLSGAIVAALVPVSAGFLLIFNPGYLDILFNTLIGQVLVVLTISFQLTGWYVISRLVRVRY